VIEAGSYSERKWRIKSREDADLQIAAPQQAGEASKAAATRRKKQQYTMAQR
jgi:hypothetical protein